MMLKEEFTPYFRWHSHRETNRWWFHFGNNCLGIEISRPKFDISFGLSKSGDHSISGSLFGFYWHIDSPTLTKALPKCDNSFRFYWLDNSLWFSLWGNDWESSSTDPWWQKTYSVDFADLLLGKAKYSRRDIEAFEDIVIPMPEGNFKAQMTFEECVWKRPRWFPKVRKYTKIKIDENPPKFSGKGESDWDCGDDGIYQMAVEGHSLPKAIGGYLEAVMEYREQRAGLKSLKYNPGIKEKE